MMIPVLLEKCGSCSRQLRKKAWLVAAAAVTLMSFSTLQQVGELKNLSDDRARTAKALGVALASEQNARRAEGEEPIAPTPDQILDDPEIVARHFGPPAPQWTFSYQGVIYLCSPADLDGVKFTCDALQRGGKNGEPDNTVGLGNRS